MNPGPKNADAAQKLIDASSDIEVTEPENSVPKRSNAGKESTSGDSKTCMERLKKIKANKLGGVDVTASESDYRHPQHRDRILDEFYSSLHDAGGFEALESGDENLGEEQRRNGIAKPAEGFGFETTDAIETINSIFDTRAKKYSVLADGNVDESFEAVTTDEKAGERIKALRYAGKLTAAPEALDRETGINARDAVLEMYEAGLIDVSRIGVETTKKGERLLDFLDDSYRIMERDSWEKAEDYLDLAELEEYRTGSLKIYGHQELVGRSMEDMEDEIPDELEAFEDY